MTDPLADRLRAAATPYAEPVPLTGLRARAHRRRVAVVAGPVLLLAAVAGAGIAATAGGSDPSESIVLAPPIPTASTSASQPSPSAFPLPTTASPEPTATAAPPQRSDRETTPPTSSSAPATASPAVTAPGSDGLPGYPGLRSPYSSGCTPVRAGVTESGSPPSELRIALSVPEGPHYSSRSVRIIGTFSIRNNGNEAVTLDMAIGGSARLAGRATARYDSQNDVSSILPETIAPGTTWSADVDVITYNCGDTAADSVIAPPTGTYQAVFNLQVFGVSWQRQATSEPSRPQTWTALSNRFRVIDPTA